MREKNKETFGDFGSHGVESLSDVCRRQWDESKDKEIDKLKNELVELAEWNMSLTARMKKIREISNGTANAKN